MINTGGGWTGGTAATQTPGVVYQNAWTWTTKTADAAGLGQVGVNATTWATVTAVNLNDQAADNTDATNAIKKLVVGNFIYLQVATDATRYARYTLITLPTNQGRYWSFPVKPDPATPASGAIPAGNTNIMVRLIGNL
jgi:hypothetical protein